MIASEQDILEMRNNRKVVDYVIDSIDKWIENENKSNRYRFPFDEHQGVDTYSSEVISYLFSNGNLHGKNVLIMNPDFRVGEEGQIWIPEYNCNRWTEVLDRDIIVQYGEKFARYFTKYISRDNDGKRTELHWYDCQIMVNRYGERIHGDRIHSELLNKLGHYILNQDIDIIIGCGWYHRGKDNEIFPRDDERFFDDLCSVVSSDFGGLSKNPKFLEFKKVSRNMRNMRNNVVSQRNTFMDLGV